MVNKKFGKDLALVILSNGVKLLASVLSMLMVPLLFSEQDYGFYKLFLLYVSYVGIFHFGFIDGIYLYYAGKDYESLDKTKFNVFTKVLFYSQTILMLILFGLSFFFSGDRQLMIIFTAVSLLINNMTSYYQFISQVTGRFKEFATVNIIVTFLTIILIGTFYIFKIKNYLLFIAITLAINLLMLFWYVYKYKDISLKKTNVKAINGHKKDIGLMLKLGIPLLLSNFIGIIIANIPKQAVEWKYPIEEFPNVFSNFSFAFTLLGFTSVFLSAVSLVLFPTLNKSNEETLKKSYNWLNAVVLVVVFILLVAYYPLVWIVQRFLTNYTDSLQYFYILAPGIALTSSISVIKHNYYKTLNKNKTYLIIGLITLVLQVIITFVLFEAFNQSVVVVAIATVVTQAIWYLITEVVLNKKLGVYSVKNNVYIVISTIAFYLMKIIGNIYIEFAVYAMVIILITMSFYFKDIKDLLAKRKNAKITTNN